MTEIREQIARLEERLEKLEAYAEDVGKSQHRTANALTVLQGMVAETRKELDLLKALVST